MDRKPPEKVSCYSAHPNIIVIIACILTISEYGEIDPDKVRAAVSTFMRSCAGYSVATYALVSKEIIRNSKFNVS